MTTWSTYLTKVGQCTETRVTTQEVVLSNSYKDMWSGHHSKIIESNAIWSNCSILLPCWWHDWYLIKDWNFGDIVLSEISLPQLRELLSDGPDAKHHNHLRCRGQQELAIRNRSTIVCMCHFWVGQLTLYLLYNTQSYFIGVNVTSPPTVGSCCTSFIQLCLYLNK